MQCMQQLITTLKNPNFNSTHEINQQVKNILKANPNFLAYIVEERCQQLLNRQQQGQPSQAEEATQFPPTMQSLQQLINALKCPKYNTQQQKQLVVRNILNASPALMVAFLKQRKQQKQKQQEVVLQLQLTAQAQQQLMQAMARTVQQQHQQQQAQEQVQVQVQAQAQAQQLMQARGQMAQQHQLQKLQKQPRSYIDSFLDTVFADEKYYVNKSV